MTCPICNRPTQPEFRPFCSRRCADVDLAKWLTGAYALPSDEPADEALMPDDPDDRGIKH